MWRMASFNSFSLPLFSTTNYMKRLSMENIRCEKGVLKLVHPGRHVEIHTEPITASEIMRRNPRHCITRPDVFKFPWIMVRPESVLSLGRVFFVVPNRTIYRLLKASGHHSQSPSLKSSAGRTPRHHKKHDRYCFNQQSQIMPQGMSPRAELEWDDQSQKCWPVMFVKPKKTWQEINKELSMDSTPDIRSSLAEEHSFNGNRINAALLKSRDGNLEATKLKSCLRKPDSVRKYLGLGVTFDLTIKNENKPRPVTSSPNDNKPRPVTSSCDDFGQDIFTLSF